MKNIVKEFKYAFMVILFFIFFGNNIYSGLYRLNQNTVKHKIINSTAGYNIEEGYSCYIYYEDTEEEYAQTIKRMADTYYPLLKSDLAYEGREKLTIILYADENQLSSALGINYREKPPMGVYYGGVINIITPEIWNEEYDHASVTERFMAHGPIIHEMVHYIIDMRLEGNYDTWFTEGMALYYEYKYTGIGWREDLKGVSEHFYSGHMNRDFGALDESTSYRYAFELIENIISTHGEEGLREVMDLLEEGAHPDKAIISYIM